MSSAESTDDQTSAYSRGFKGRRRDAGASDSGATAIDAAAPSSSSSSSTSSSSSGGATSSSSSGSSTSSSGATIAPKPAPAPAPAPTPTTTTTPPPVPTTTSDKVWGVTVDSVSNLSAITESLRRLPHKPTTRIVFDEQVPATDYVAAATDIGAVSYVMGELLDSFYVNTYTTPQYLARADEYLQTLGSKVDIWEIGNEINGEWLGDTATVVAKMTGAYDKTVAAGKKTALTLYYNQNCWEKADHEMFAWTAANVPDRMKAGLDYVLISY